MTTEMMKGLTPPRRSDDAPAWSDEPSPHLSDWTRGHKPSPYASVNTNDKANANRQAKAELAAQRRVHQVRIDTLKSRILDRIDGVLDRLTPPPPPDLPLVLARRQIAHLVGAPHLCARQLCRRRHACCGEPTQCLAAILPLLPADTVKALALGARRTRRGRA